MTNTGRRAGAEVPQVYVGFPASSGEPPKQLKGFAKVSVQAPGDAEHVRIELDQRAFSYWTRRPGAWRATPAATGSWSGARRATSWPR